MLVSKEYLWEHVNDADTIILDTRPKIAYSYGHLKKSQHISLEDVIEVDQYGSNLVASETKLAELFGSLGIDQSKTVILGGQYMDPAVARIAWTLKYLGHEKTQILNVDLSTLPDSGFEITREPHKVSPTNFVPSIKSDLRITSDELYKNLTQFTILDARTPQEYLSGHIQNSELFSFTEGIGLNGEIFQDEKKLSRLFDNIDNNKEIICYCTHGHRASSLFFQLKLAGYKKVRLYDGSFVEWYGKKLPLD